MRKLSLFLLLATVATPVLAAPGDDNSRAERRAARAEAKESDDRPQRATPAARPERSQQSEARMHGAQRSERSRANEQGTTEAIRARVLQHQQQAAAKASGDIDNASARTLRRAERQRSRSEAAESGGTAGTLAPRQSRVRTIPETNPAATTTDRRGQMREAAREWLGGKRRDYNDGNYRRWSRNWHNDRRYDWRRHRDRHRSIFRIGFYYDPFGWNYRRWGIGSFLYPSYFGSRYWLNDPWQYRLPPAYGPYRWVRYWDDALLVNIYTGEVVDVMHNFFW
jgi:hypothetical protein